MTENGLVVKEQGDNAVVRFQRRSACDKCGMCGGDVSQSTIEVVSNNQIGAKEGDEVIVEIKSQLVLISAVIAYLIPLAVAFGVILVCSILKCEEWVSFVGFLGALAVGYAIVHFVSKKFTKKIQLDIIEIVSQKE